MLPMLPFSRDQWGGPDWRLCPQAPPPKPLHSPRASGEMRRGGGATVLPPLSPHNPGLGLWCLFREAEGGAGKLVVGDDPVRC